MPLLRISVVLSTLMLLSSCALWPFGKKEAQSCLDDNSCETSNPFEEALIGGTWHCYGKSKDEPWDCSQVEDNSKIVAIAETTRVQPPEAEPPAPIRQELALQDEISSDPVTAKAEVPDILAGHPESSFAVQLIALQTRGEVNDFAANHNIETPLYVNIESQGNTWYVMLLGVYSSKSEADTAADAWQAQHNPASKPWVRPLGPLRQAALRAAGDGS